MSQQFSLVTIHPYFKVHPGKMDALKALLPLFVEKASEEEKTLYYDFTIRGDEVATREAYEDAEGALLHLQNVSELLRRMEEVATLDRLEIHGPAEELAKMKSPLAGLDPSWFEFECGIELD